MDDRCADCEELDRTGCYKCGPETLSKTLHCAGCGLDIKELWYSNRRGAQNVYMTWYGNLESQIVRYVSFYCLRCRQNGVYPYLRPIPNVGLLDGPIELVTGDNAFKEYLRVSGMYPFSKEGLELLKMQMMALQLLKDKPGKSTRRR